MKSINASELVKDIENNNNFTSKFILEKIVKAVSQVGKKEMTIEINSDDDFSVNGKSRYKESFPVGKTSYKEMYLHAINTLDFGIHQEGNWKLKSFKEDMYRNDLIEEIASSGFGSAGGNRTIDVFIEDAPNKIQFLGLEVDLTK